MRNRKSGSARFIQVILLISLCCAILLTAVSSMSKNGRKDATGFRMERYLFFRQPLYRKSSRGFVRTGKKMHPQKFTALQRNKHKYRANFLQLKHSPSYWVKEAYTSAASLIREGRSLRIGGERVDRWYALGPDYKPADLVALPSRLCKFRKVRMRRESARAFVRLARAAARDGIRIYAFSGYRPFAVQKRLYLRRIRIGRKLKQRAVARPGHSEHQLGTTVDVVGKNTALAATSAFGRTRAAKWLRKRCYDFGFVLSYGPDNTIPTGYIVETWHIRYIGRDNIPAWKKSHL